MNTKHTPGPWVIDPDYRNDPGAINGGDNLRRVVKWDGFARRHTPEAVANARLIAAAPDLLASLRALLDIVHDDLTHERQEDHREALNAAKNAIAKATQP